MARPIRKVDSVFGVPNFLQLFPPPQPDTYNYFDGSSEYPFDAAIAGHSPVNAWWMAELSLLAYSEEQDVEQILKDRFPASKQTFFWLDSKATSTQGFGLETDEYIIVAFRGTEFPPPGNVLRAPLKLREIILDIRTDIRRLNPTTIDEGIPVFDTPVHPGFAESLQNVWQDLQRHLSANNKPLWLTGHSLGGAIATLLAYQLPERVNALYTFGSPCVGTQAFADAFNEKKLTAKTYRYLHGNDAVAKALDIYSTKYKHVGQLFPLDAGLRRGLLGYGLNLVLGSTIAVNQLDHAPIIYSFECWNAIP